MSAIVVIITPIIWHSFLLSTWTKLHSCELMEAKSKLILAGTPKEREGSGTGGEVNRGGIALSLKYWRRGCAERLYFFILYGNSKEWTLRTVRLGKLSWATPLPTKRFFFSLFKEFLLQQEFYNPNYVSLLSYQFCYLKQKWHSELFHSKELQN